MPKIVVKNSTVHGRGVFAATALPAGTRIIEYKGERIDWDEALRRHPHDPAQPNHTFYFSLDDGWVIDGGRHGNSARWINHACAPNCTTEEIPDQAGTVHVWVLAARDIAAGEELFYDYRLEIDAPYTKKLKQEFACHCGSPECRGTMLYLGEPKKKKDKPAKQAKKAKKKAADKAGRNESNKKGGKQKGDKGKGKP